MRCLLYQTFLGLATISLGFGFSLPAAADCPSAIKAASRVCCDPSDSKCKSTTQAELNDPSTPPDGLGNAGGLASETEAAGTANAEFADKCEKPANTCATSCKDAGYEGALELCRNWQSRAKQARQQADKFSNASKDAKKTDTASTDKTDDKKSGDGSGGGGGSPPSPPTDDKSQTPTPMPAPTADNANPSSSDASKTPADGGGSPPSPVGFSNAAAGDGGGSKSAGLGSGIDPFSGSTGMNPSSANLGTNSSMKGGSSGTAMLGGGGSKPPAEKPGGDPEGDGKHTNTNILNGERGGGGGSSGEGGGFSGYQMGHNGGDGLEEYLPGGKKAARSMASLMKTASLHPDIKSAHSNIFEAITKRFQIHCALKQLKGCN